MDKVKKKITMLNLYRCSSEKKKITETGIDYFSMDYFDGIKIENINVKENDDIPTLGICMGIKAEANKKQGISHQRYCLSREENDDFEGDLKYPLLTVIQVFINPDLYQAEEFADVYTEDDTKKITCANCMMRVQKHIERMMPSDKDVKVGVYRLVTEGDFAVLVWSNTVHDAYDVTTLVRNISISYDSEVPESSESALFSYSIMGVWNHTGEQVRELNWFDYLEQDDKVAVRFEYSSRFRAAGAQKDKELIDCFLKGGQRLLGRYDHQILLNCQQFQELYPYITDYKFGNNPEAWEEIDKIQDNLVRVTVNMMKKGYVSYINEKLLLEYSEDPYFRKEASDVWNVKIKGHQDSWKTLYYRNEEMIGLGKKRWEEAEKRLKNYYQSGGNMKEYLRLAGRFYRVLNEMNQLMELRVSTANLLRQMKVMLDSLLAYLDYAQNCNWDTRAIADCIERYLQQGIYAVEIFMRYVRNINLQTLQTPNYDLQTNVCIEKVLLAYSQMVRPLTEKSTQPDAGLYLNCTLYPIVVPSMANKDLTVGILFGPSSSEDKLMVVSTPTFLFMCDTCFMIPAVFHEIGHQYRYESRKKRNRCLVRTIYKNLIVGVLQKIINSEYPLQDETEFEALINDMCDYIEQELGMQTKEKYDLRFMEVYMISIVEQIADSEETNLNIRSLEENVMDYIEKTKENVQSFDKEILEVIKTLTAKLDCYKETKEKLRKNLKEGLKTENYREDKGNVQQSEKLYEEIMAEMHKYYSCQVRQINARFKEILGNRFQMTDENKFRQWELEELLENNPKDSELRECAQAAVNIQIRYRDYEQRNLRFNGEWENVYEDLLKDISKAAYKKLTYSLEEFQKNRKKWGVNNFIGIPENDIEYARKRLSLEKEKLVRTKISEFLKESSRKKLTELISTTIDLYREITADLFMCTAIKFTTWGYLIFITQMHGFKTDIEMELYQRIFAVVQCFIAKEKGHEPDDDEYNDYLNEMIRTEISALFVNLRNAGIVKEILRIDDIEDALECLEREKENVMRSSLKGTQKWIYRVYHQATVITWNIYNVRVSSKVPLQYDIWKDISSEESYMNKEAEIETLIGKTKISQLSKAITQILNSPVKFFNQRKELLDEEIDFVFDNYEENCRNVFR